MSENAHLQLLEDSCKRESIKAAFTSVFLEAKSELEQQDSFRRMGNDDNDFKKPPTHKKPLGLRDYVPCAKNGTWTVCLPYFVILGAARGGTTSMWQYLVQHPQIKAGKSKQSHFFSDQEKWNQGFNYYFNFFPRNTNASYFVTFEASTFYLSSYIAPSRMSRILPNAKLILLLRDPVERAYSQFLSTPPMVKSTEGFEYFIDQELQNLQEVPEGCYQDDIPARMFRTYCQSSILLNRGIYIQQIQNWLKYYPLEQLLIITAEDFFKNPKAEIRKILRFLELTVEDDFLQDMTVYAASDRGGEVIRPETRRRLENFFRPYNQQLQEFLGRSFHWSS